MQWKRFTLIVVGVLAVLGALAFLTWPGVLLHRAAKGPALSGSGRPSGALTAVSCLGSAGPLVPREFLDSKHVDAMAMVSQKQFDRAVTELRNIAAADPAYPGIDLDLSDALLQSQHVQEAKGAINTQIAVSDCLIELPDHALQDYCAVELAQSSKDGCRSQLVQMQRAAHFQAALIDMALATSVKPAAPTEVAESSPYPEPRPKPAEAPERLAPVAKVVPPAPAAPAAHASQPPAAAVSTAPKPVVTLAAADRPAPRPVAAVVSAPPVKLAPATPAAAAEPTPAPVAVSAAPKPIPVAAPAQPPPSAEVASLATVQPADSAIAPKQPAAATTGTLRPIEASQHVGETRTVCGPVVGKHTAPTANGNPTFVELDRSYPNQIFTVLVWGSDKGEVGELPASGNVCVTGKISSYAGLPEIVLHKATDWSVPNGSSNP